MENKIDPFAESIHQMRREMSARLSSAFPSISLADPEDRARQKFIKWMQASGWSGKVSQSTVETYVAVARSHLVLSKGTVKDMWWDGLTNRRTYQVRKAAVMWTLRMKLLAWADPDAFREAFPWAGNPAGPSGMRDIYTHWLALQEAQKILWSEIPHGPVTRRGGKKGLSKIPHDAFSTIFYRCSRKWRPYACVLELSGCRPSEIENGVCVQLVANGGLHFMIRGAKTDAVPEKGMAEEKELPKGQGMRSFVIFPDRKNFRAEFLRKMVEQQSKNNIEMPEFDTGGKTYWILPPQKAKYVSRYFYELAKNTWPNREAERRPSAYSYRHNFANTAKASLTREDAAKAMGQASSKTIGVYGSAGKKSKSSAVRMDRVKGQRQVRMYDIKIPEIRKDREITVPEMSRDMSRDEEPIRGFFSR